MMGWRRWADRSQVERVDLYTRQSLFWLVWAIPAVLLARVLTEGPVGPPLAWGALLLGTVLFGSAATWLLRRACALHPATGPMPRRAMLGFAVACLAAGAGVLLIEAEELRGAAATVLMSMVVWGYGGFRDLRVTVAVLAFAGGVLGLASQTPGVALFGLLMAAFLVFTIRSSLWLLGVVTELAATRDARAALEVAEERLRFSRDVHDVLGRRLSTIGVQAELAATLAERGDPSAAGPMREVHASAHEALREARELARGYRTTDLAQEVEGAGALLRSAGIRCDVDLDSLDPGWHEAAGWVVREAVTNVLRHSRATWVRIRYADGALVVRNDGAPGDAVPTPGTGLLGLRERLQPLGATVGAGPVAGEPGTFEMRVRLQRSDVPASAGAAT